MRYGWQKGGFKLQGRQGFSGFGAFSPSGFSKTNKYSGGSLESIPTFILFGDSNADGRGTTGTTGTLRYPEYAVDIINSIKTTVKIFDNTDTDTFVTLSKDTSQVRNAPLTYTHGFEQVLMWELAQYYGTREIRIIKWGNSGDIAKDWMSGGSSLALFEAVLASAELAATNEGVTLDFKACISTLGTNDAGLEVDSLAYESDMTSVINYFRTSLFSSNTPFLLLSAFGAHTYSPEVRTYQENLASTLSGVSYVSAYNYSPLSLHPDNGNYFGISLELANAVLTDVLLQSDIKEKYAFSFQHNISGTYDILVYLDNVSTFTVIMDWGDGNQSPMTTGFETLSHNYADSTIKTITLITFIPWVLERLEINSALLSGIQGNFDLTDLTGLAGFAVPSGNVDMTSITPPRDNYDYFIQAPANLFNNTGLVEIDFTRFLATSGVIQISNNDNLTSFIDTTLSKAWNANGSTFSNNNALITLDLSNVPKFNSRTQIIGNDLLEIVIFNPLVQVETGVQGFWVQSNPELYDVINYENVLQGKYISFLNNNLPTSLLDSMLNEMWDRCQDTPSFIDLLLKTYRLNGNNDISGSYGSTVDWSGGLPTSPAAKAYDLLNDITGTYNFSTLDVDVSEIDPIHFDVTYDFEGTPNNIVDNTTDYEGTQKIDVLPIAGERGDCTGTPVRIQYSLSTTSPSCTAEILFGKTTSAVGVPTVWTSINDVSGGSSVTNLIANLTIDNDEYLHIKIKLHIIFAAGRLASASVTLVDSVGVACDDYFIDTVEAVGSPLTWSELKEYDL